LIRTYVDSGVLIALYTAREVEQQAADILLSDARRRFVVSPFVELEVLPHLQRDKRDLFEAARKLMATFDPAKDLEAALEVAYDVCLSVPLSAVDALHVGAAVSSRCDELVTTERAAKAKSIHRASGFIPILHIQQAI
jgi:predicted nucleic acid-binding protein